MRDHSSCNVIQQSRTIFISYTKRRNKVNVPSTFTNYVQLQYFGFDISSNICVACLKKKLIVVEEYIFQLYLLRLLKISSFTSKLE